MDAGRTALRLFLLVLAAAIPPLILALVALARPPWITRLGPGTAFLIFLLITAAVTAVVTIVGARGISADVSAMLDLARRGRSTGASVESDSSGSGSGAYQRLATMLDERNRQIGQLAASLRASPIQRTVRDVARTAVRAAISVTGDPTWTLTVLRSPSAALPNGVYGADTPEPAALSEVALWAATLEPDLGSDSAVRYGLGPWGAFTVIEVAAGDELRAILTAPWEGRPPPSESERELLSLLGQNAAIAVEHALLVEQLRSQTEELNRMAGVQSDFLRGVTHDLQTPLTSIRALAAETAEQAELSDDSRADLETISHQADRMRRMVAQLLVASRLEVGALQPLQEIFRPEPIIRRTWDALRAPRPFSLEVTGSEHLVVGDPDRFEQVLWALFDNAVKYSPEGSPIRVSLSSQAGPGPDSSDERSVIAISDQGAGMDAETVTRAFDQFYRADGARRLAPDGSGVGLYAVRGLVEAMTGSVHLESHLGQGTTVTVELPAEILSEAAETPVGTG